jgi:hypothetical protein
MNFLKKNFQHFFNNKLFSSFHFFFGGGAGGGWAEVGFLFFGVTHYIIT